MSKHFINFPPELEQYNPEIVKPEMDFIRETLDDNNLLHSFNDEPSYAEEGPLNFLKLKWHSHGELYRESGDPLSVTIMDNSYFTGDETGKAHSYNGMPGMIEIYDGELILNWFKNGVSHREGDQPAEIIWRISSGSKKAKFQEKTYYVNGKKSRINNLPTTVGIDSTSWEVEGQFHNSNGFALEEKSSSHGKKTHIWCLYGIEITENNFNNIITYAKIAKVPLWVSFLVTLEFVEQNSLSFFKNDDNRWNSTVPLLWVLRSWGVNKTNFSQNIIKLHERNKNISIYTNSNEDELLDSFIDIANLEYKVS